MTTATPTSTPDAIAVYECSFDYDFLSVGDLRVETVEDPKTGKKTVTKVLVKDEPLNPTNRFWVSLFARYGFNSAFFKYFNHQETFERISQTEKADRMRLCIERDADGNGTLLGVSNPKKPIVVYDELMEMLGRYNGTSIMYHDGIVESTHTPRSGANQFQIAGDDFVNRFLLSTPVDGYGAPNIYLSMLRLACSNGVVGYTKVFRSSLALGKADDDVTPSMTRALDGFSNDEGYAAIRQRLKAAACSWCSVHESQELYKLLVRLHSRKAIDDMGGMTLASAPKLASLLGNPVVVSVQTPEEGVGSPILKAFHAMTGDTSRLYGLANLDALSVKRKRTLPVKCKVMDVINFATEVATHYSTPEGARMLQAFVGGLVTEEYDMEGTADKYGEFADFLIDAKMEAGFTGSEYAGKGAGEHRGIAMASQN
jgi:hypothetical protein